MRLPDMEFVVVIPAHNEQDVLRRCLTALARARAELRLFCEQAMCPEQTVRSRVIVVVDASSDNTAAIAADMGVQIAHVDSHCVGAARAAGARLALAGSEVADKQVWLCNTDADSTVPANWLAHLLALSRTGAELVLGTVEPELTRSNGALVERWHRAHTLADGHAYIHGANFGIRADAYRSLGGWSRLQTGEDVDLATRALTAGLVIARTAGAPVRTSARLIARAPSGYASFLRDLDAARPRTVTVAARTPVAHVAPR